MIGVGVSEGVQVCVTAVVGDAVIVGVSAGAKGCVGVWLGVLLGEGIVVAEGVSVCDTTERLHIENALDKPCALLGLLKIKSLTFELVSTHSFIR